MRSWLCKRRRVAGLGKFMCDGGDGYNCMGPYDLHGRLTVSLLACPGELAQVYDKICGMKSIHVDSVLECGVW